MEQVLNSLAEILLKQPVDKNSTYQLTKYGYAVCFIL